MATIAAFGTATTSSRRAIRTWTSAFIPGLSRPSGLSSRTSTGNIVTFCSTTACGSILRTVPAKVRLGYASTVTWAGSPALIWPMSVSSTSVRTCISVRSAIWKRVVPPEMFWLADWMIWPTSTLFWMIVPSSGARIVTSLIRSRASSRFVCALTNCERAFATSNSVFSNSCSVITLAARSSSERRRWASAVASRARATSRSASACASAFRTSRGSTSARSAPRSTKSPVSTWICRISPLALDLTSTIRIGSI